MKRGIYFVATCVALFCVVIGFSITVNAANYYDTTIGNYSCRIYTTNDYSHVVKIKDCDATVSGIVEIPSELQGYPVTDIGENAFYNCVNITEIIIPDSVTSIGASAFSDCSNLTKITLPNTLTSISDSMFYGCENLVQVDIPNSVTTIENNAFYGCSSLQSITIHSNITDIGIYAFRDCTNVKTLNYNSNIGEFSSSKHPFYNCGLSAEMEVFIGDSVNNIPDYFLYNNANVKSVTLGKNIKSIGYNAFLNCSELADINLVNGITNIGESAFNGCSSLFEIDFPESVSRIEYRAFYGCSSLTTISLPDSINYIGSGAFYGCSNVTEVRLPNNITSINDNLFSNCSNLIEIQIPSTVSNIGSGSFSGCSSLKEITLSDKITNIGSYAFSNCSKISEITIPKNVTNIGDAAFSSCNNITKINYNALNCEPFLTTNLPFKNCGSDRELTVVVDDNVEQIPKCFLYNNSNVTDVIIGKKVTTIGHSAFYGCNKLSEIEIPITVTDINSNAFYGCSSLQEITIPENVMTIGDAAFGKCNGIKTINYDTNHIESFSSTNLPFENCGDTNGFNVVVSDFVEKIPEYFLYNNSSVTNVYFGEKITGVGNNAFYGCINLSNIEVPNSVTSIGNYAFSNCTTLKKIVIPKNVYSIGVGTFKGCSSLEEITLPFIGSQRGNSGTIDSVFGFIFGYVTSSSDATTDDTKQYYTSSGYAYYHIPASLKTVTITDESFVGYGAFYGCTSISDIVIDSNVKAIGSRAFAYHYNLLNVTIKSTSPKFADSLVFYETDFATLYGYPGSTVEEHAIKNGIDFESLVMSGHCEIDGSIKAVNSTLVVSVDLNAIVTDECLHIALYTDNGQMVDYIIVPSDKPFNTMNVVFKDNKDSSYAKVFLWNGVTSMQPLTEAKKIDIVR